MPPRILKNTQNKKLKNAPKPTIPPNATPPKNKRGPLKINGPRRSENGGGEGSRRLILSLFYQGFERSFFRLLVFYSFTASPR
jgi:hypothetical protein